MGLSAVLVDQGRILRQQRAGAQVGGRTQFAQAEPGQWFDCRLFLPTMPESFDPQRVGRRVVRMPTLLYGVEDQDGNEFVLLPSDYVEIESEDLGNATWQVTAAGQPLRRKSGVLGYQTTVKRIEIDEAA